MLERFLLVWLVLSSAAAFVFSDAVAPAKVTLPWLITVTMFCVGMMLPRDEVRQVFKRWPTVFGGTAIQYAIMPLLAVGFGKLFGLTGDAFIGIVVVGCVPGAMASNVLTLNARGNTSYSVSLTTAATFLSPVAVPLVLALALQSEGAVDKLVLWRASKMLMITVVLPVLIGHALGQRFPRLEKLSQRFGAIIANLAILLIIAIVVAISKDKLTQFQANVLVALILVNLLGYVAGYCGGLGMRLPEPMRRALTLEVGMQNAGLGAVLASSLFPGKSMIALPPVLYMVGCMLTGTALAQFWSKRYTDQPAETSTKPA